MLSKHSSPKVIAAYKWPYKNQKGEAGNSKWVVSEYFSTEWESEDNPRKPLPQALNLGRLYERLLDVLIPEESGADEPILKRVAINAELREIMQELKKLEDGPQITQMGAD